MASLVPTLLWFLAKWYYTKHKLSTTAFLFLVLPIKVPNFGLQISKFEVPNMGLLSEALTFASLFPTWVGRQYAWWRSMVIATVRKTELEKWNYSFAYHCLQVFERVSYPLQKKSES